MLLDLERLLSSVNTYPSAKNNTYKLNTKKLTPNELEVYYIITAGATKKRILRKFPAKIKLTPELAWSLGFIKGEGANSKGTSNYRRFTLTNSDPVNVLFVMRALTEAKIIDKDNLKAGTIQIMHSTGPPQKVVNYWQKNLRVKKEAIKIVNDSDKRNYFGICHLYISDVLLRRVVDVLNETLFNNYLL